jgi:glutaredoxin
MFKKIFPFLIAFGIIFSLFYLLSHSSSNSNPVNNPEPTPTDSQTSIEASPTPKNYPVYDNPDLIFYYGDGCPHCENVEFWLEDNDPDSKIKINYKEVYYSDTNSDELYKNVEQYCPELISSTGSIGVPIALDPIENQCIQGDVPIIEFLSTKVAK